MAIGTDRILYVGTTDGLFQARSNGNGTKATRLGLQGCGTLRCPIVIDRMDPQCLYAATSRRGVLRSEDGGGSWQEVNDATTEIVGCLHLRYLGADQSQHDHLTLRDKP